MIGRVLFVTTVSFVINYHPGAIKLSISASAQRQSSKSKWNETKNVILPFFKFSHFLFSKCGREGNAESGHKQSNIPFQYIFSTRYF